MLINKPMKKNNKITLPFIQKYKDKITHIPKEGPLKTIIPEYSSLNQSKATSNNKLQKENYPQGLNYRVSSKDDKIIRRKLLFTEQKQDAMCIKLDQIQFQNMIKTLQLPSISNKAGKNLDKCRYMMIVLKD